MASRIAALLTALIVSTILALPGRAATQQHGGAPYPYILIDLGTLGGPQSCVQGPSVLTLNNQGEVTGMADTPIPDSDSNPTLPGCYEPDPFISHVFLWQHGVLADLGALPGNNNSIVGALSASGIVVGASENGITDPYTGYTEGRTLLWRHGRQLVLGTFGGNESGALDVNNGGQVVGAAANTIPDPFSMLGWGTQTRGFLWQDGHMLDLGTLGGNDTFALYINNRGQVSGQSFTNAVSNTVTGMPTMDPFLWQDGHMIDLGTLGGNNGFAIWINEAGTVAGYADEPGSQTHHGFLWKNGVMTDLGVVPGDQCTAALAVNAWDQTVGDSSAPRGNAVHAFLWQRGAIYDLNTLIAPSSLQVINAYNINDRGEIAGFGLLPDGDRHAVLLIPSALAASEGLASNAPAPGTARPRGCT